MSQLTPAQQTAPSHPNRLIHETSPYLLQHAHNPVDWYPWGDEALQRARQEDKPILLSIGYSACHWCHVMAHESFEDEATAAIMNREFVNIKVDREERPDLDAIYMAAVQALTGGGGWPMTVFLTPDGIPFYGGTYFPPTDRHGLPAFRRVLIQVAQVYRTRRADIQAAGRELLAHLQRASQVTPTAGRLSPARLDQAADLLANAFDPVNGGFGAAPKFPQPMMLEFLLRHYHRTGNPRSLAMVRQTLTAMASGGIYDHLGGGFHRYSTDPHWLVPHFEKMLYDNSQLARLYLHAYQVTGDPLYRRVVEETLDYVRREMTDPRGGFYSTQDADSEGEEGRFFLWTPEEIERLLPPAEAELFCLYYNVTPAGNFEGKTILSVPRPAAEVARQVGVSESTLTETVQRARATLFAAREQRVRPGRDDKVITSWNGLMLAAFAEAGRVLGRDDYLAVAHANARFLLTAMCHGDTLWHTWKGTSPAQAGLAAEGRVTIPAFLDDYAALGDGLLTLYEATGETGWLTESRRLADTLIDLFTDDTNGGFFDTARNQETLIVRPKTLYDNAVPSGNALAAGLLLRLARLSGEADYERRAVGVLDLLAESMAQMPAGFGHALSVLDFHLSLPLEIALVGPRDDPATQALLVEAHRPYLPNKVVVLHEPGDPLAAQLPLLAGKTLVDGRPAAYVCRVHTCAAPVTDPLALRQQLQP